MSGDEWLTAYERLRAEQGALEEALAKSRGRVAQLEAEAAEWQAAKALLREEKAHLEAQNEHLREALDEARALIEDLRRQLFGSKADRLTPEQEEQLKQILKDLKAAAARPGPVSGEVLSEENQQQGKPARRRRRPRQPLPADLETETITIEPDDKTCPCCGVVGHKIGEEVTEELDLVPAKVIRRRIVRPKYAHACDCENRRSVAIAPLPSRLIPQSTLGLGLAVHILLTRYDDHLSFYRLEQQFWERHHVVVARQQMVQWVEHIAEWLRPIYDAMWQAMLTTGYLQVDETPVRVLDPDVKGKSVRGYLWFYAVPAGDVILEFDRHRSLDPVRTRLKPFVGTIQTDAYEVYQSLARNEDGITRIGCLAHVRRRYYAALRDSIPDALWFINQIRALYRIEDDARDLSPAARLTLREERNAQGLWKEMKEHALAIQPRFLPKSRMGNAIQYFLNEYDPLVGYLRDGRFEIDNNLVENSIRPTAVGRRRWLFIGHPNAGWRSAIVYSLIVSCRRRGINPQHYLADILARLPAAKITEIASLLPANWKPQEHNTS